MVWATLTKCGGDDVDTKYPGEITLQNNFCYFGRAPQNTVSNINNTPNRDLQAAIDNGRVDFVVLTPPYISITHFAIKRKTSNTIEDDEKLIWDCPTLTDMSTNGTLLDGVLVGKGTEVELRDNSLISIKFKFVYSCFAMY